MIWTDLDWAALDRHRERFLEGRPCDEPYWDSAGELASYDATYGERIGWKWDAVLEELRIRGWAPPGGTLLDWGCGSGVAGRRTIACFGPGRFDSLVVWDHSPLAVDYALEAAARQFPSLAASAATRGYLDGGEPIGLLVLSHVLNELRPETLSEIRALADRSRAVIWTEPGAHGTSRALGALRDAWLGAFRVVAPCTHANPCPILGHGNERHWCHHFAAPPRGIFADANWVKFGQRAGIDLRSLPYSFLALDRDWDPRGGGLSRIIGRPEPLKPYVRFLNCDADGLAELMVTRRTDAALCKELERTKRPLVYQWARDGQRITRGSAPAP